MSAVLNKPAPGAKRTGAAAAAGMAATLAMATAIIGQFEGKRNDPYLDIVRVKTVCYGETQVAMRHYSNAECSAMLSRAVESRYAKPVYACTPMLREHRNQAAAAISLAYNIGVQAYCRSTVDRRFDARDIKGACNAFLMWSKAGGRTVQGLLNRRTAERALCLQGA